VIGITTWQLTEAIGSHSNTANTAPAEAGYHCTPANSLKYSRTQPVHPSNHASGTGLHTHLKLDNWQQQRQQQQRTQQDTQQDSITKQKRNQ